MSAQIVNSELGLFKTLHTCERTGSRKTSARLSKAVITGEQQRIDMLGEEHREEVLAFLARRAQQTFLMTSWIMDNGIKSPLNRGTFYGHRNDAGHLDGVALIGHVTLFETNDDDALMRFARLAQQEQSTNTLLGEVEKVSRFLSHFTFQEAPRLLNRERLFERRERQDAIGSGKELRLAVAADLPLVAPVHAQMAFEESGINPIFVDPEGFYQRCKRRIEQNRVWVSIEDGQLMFKADVISETPEVAYLEGVYVNPSKRRNGIAVRLLIDLTNRLLAHANSVCLLANQENSAAIACYNKAGFKVRELYDTVYLGTPRSQQPS